MILRQKVEVDKIDEGHNEVMRNVKVIISHAANVLDHKGGEFDEVRKRLDNKKLNETYTSKKWLYLQFFNR